MSGNTTARSVVELSLSPAFLLAHTDLPNPVKVIWVRSNRVFYRRYQPPAGKPRRRGHPRR